MPDTKHTPGPWKYQAEVTVDPMGRRPKRTQFEVYTASGKFGHPATCDLEADARLIAAAPDLLAALETLLDRMTDGRREMSRGELEENADLIRAALTKAQGKP